MIYIYLSEYNNCATISVFLSKMIAKVDKTQSNTQNTFTKTRKNIKPTNNVIKQLMYKYSKTCLGRPLKIYKTKVLKTDGSLLQVEIIAECSLGAKIGLDHLCYLFLVFYMRLRLFIAALYT